MAHAVSQSVTSERSLWALWQHAHALPDGLVARDGRRFRVVYPGRPNPRAGPDFRDAVMLTESGERITGDVELHLNAPDWYAHRHHLDANYNGVVLHVVLRTKGASVSGQMSGMSAPVASLETPQLSAEETAIGPGLDGTTDIGRLLDIAGDRRFLAKSRGFSLEMADGSPEQVLYSAIMEALGYASNTRPFRQLAQRVPVVSLLKLRSEPPTTRLLSIKAALLCASGLSAQVTDPADAKLLRRLRRRLPPVRPMSPGQWHTFRVRPANHPIARITGAAHLIDRYVTDGLVAGLERGLLQPDASDLAALVAVPPWIGEGRARDITVNVVLPFLHAYAGLRGDPGLARRCLELYHSHPKLQDNEVTREMAALLDLEARDIKVSTARRQQGLIQLYRELPHRLAPAD